MNFIIIFSLLIVLFCFLVLSFLIEKLIFALPILLGAPFVPVGSKDMKRILKLANPKPEETLYDLGSGDGRVIIEAVKNYNVKAIGVEINPILVYFSRYRLKRLGLQKKARILSGNFFRKDLSQADVIITYLLQPTNNRLEKKFLKELKPKTRIVSKSFTFENLPLIKSDSENPNLRLYQVPEAK